MALPTLNDYTTRLDTAERDLRTATTTLANARTDYEKVNNPTVFFTPEERAMRQERSLPALMTAEQEAARAVEDALTLASDVTALTVNAFPTLSSSDEAVAASRATFVREDVESLSVRELTARIRQAALQGDTISLFLFLRYAPSRLKASRSATGPHDDGDVPFPSKDSDGDARADLQAVLNDVRESFRSPDLKRLHDKAVGLRATAFDLDNAVRARARQAETYVFQSANEVAW